MDLIARLAGVSRPLDYEPFADKAALYEAAIRREVIRLAGVMQSERAATRALPARDRIAARYRAMISAALAQPGGTGMLARAVETQTQAGINIGGAVSASMAAALRDELRELGFPDNQFLDQLAHLVLALGYAVVRGCRKTPMWLVDALVEMITDMTFALLTTTRRDVLATADTPTTKETP